MTNWSRDFLSRRPELTVLRRSERSLHCLRPDGLVEATFTLHPIHYLDGDTWREIDTDLTPGADGLYGAPGLGVRLGTRGESSVPGKGFASQTSRVGVWNPSASSFTPLVTFPTGSVAGDTIKRSSGGFTHTLRLTESGARESIIVSERPPVRAGEYLVVESEFTGVSLPNGPHGHFTARGLAFNTPTAFDAAGKPVRVERFAIKVGGSQRVYTGVLAQDLDSASYPLTIDPDYTDSTNDARVIGYNTVYATARAGNSTFHAAETASNLGQEFDGVNYGIYRLLFKFDTSAIPDTATVTQVNLKATPTSINTGVAFDVQVVKDDWSARDPVAAGNAVTNFTSVQSASLDSSIFHAALTMTANTQYASGNLDTAWVSKTGPTYYAMQGSIDRAGTAPTSYDYVVFAMAEHVTPGYRPVLTVLYSLVRSAPASAALKATLARAAASSAVLFSTHRQVPVSANLEGGGYYFSYSTGSDANPGTVAAPFKTLAKLSSLSIVPGTHIYFKRGDTWPSSALVISASGASGNPIVIDAYGTGALPIIDRGGIGITWGHAVEITGSYVTVRYIKGQAAHEAAFYVAPGATGASFIACEGSGSGTGIYAKANNITVRGCYLHDLTMIVNGTGGPDGDYGAVGVWLEGKVAPITGAEIDSNRIVNCRALSTNYGYDGGAMELNGSVSGVQFHHNYISGCQGGIEIGQGSTDNVQIFYNVWDLNYLNAFMLHLSGTFSSTATNWRVENNTFVFTASSWRVLDTSGTALPVSFIFRNNTVHSSLVFTNSSGFTHNNNVYYFTGGANLGTIALGVGEMIADPMFLNYAASDYHPTATSPTIDAGVELGRSPDFDGNTVPTYNPVLGSHTDIGAYEYHGNSAARSIAASLVLSALVRLRTVPGTAALGVRYPRTAPASAALSSASRLRPIPVAARLGGSFGRSVPATMTLTKLPRAVPATVWLRYETGLEVLIRAGAGTSPDIKINPSP